jgi:methionyl-tRNA formyltransferase
MPLRTIFFGTPEFAVPTLTKLIDSPDIEIIGIVTQPDARRGRGNQLLAPPVKTAALERRLTCPIWQPERLKKDEAVLSVLADLAADVFVVVAYGQILSQRILDLPRYGCINVHGSLLPKYRGAAPIQWAIANGETVTGITTMQMDAGIDTGAMLLKASLEISPEDNSETLSAKLAEIGGDLLLQTLGNLSQIAPVPQDDSAVPANCKYAPMITKEQFILDWSRSAVHINQQIRAFYPNCYTTYQGQRLKVLATTPELTTDSEAISDHGHPGTITAIRKGSGFVVKTGTGDLVITSVQPAGKKIQSGWNFANGARLQVGTVLGQPE